MRNSIIYKLIFLGLIFSLFTKMTVFSDMVYLNNGDKIAGNVKSINKEAVLVKIEYGELKFKHLDIYKIKLNKIKIWSDYQIFKNKQNFEKASEILEKIKLSKQNIFSHDFFETEFIVLEKENQDFKEFKNIMLLRVTDIENFKKNIIAFIDKTKKTTDANLLAQFSLAEVYISENKFIKANEIFSSIPKKLPNSLLNKILKSTYNRFIVYRDLIEKYEKLITSFNKVKNKKWRYSNVKEYKQISNECKKLVAKYSSSKNPNLIRINQLYLDCLLEQGEYKYFFNAIFHHHDILMLFNQSNAELFLDKQFDNYYSKKDYSYSIKILKYLISNHQKSSRTPFRIYKLVKCLYRLKKYNKAYDYSLKYKRIFPNNPWIKKCFFKLAHVILLQNSNNKKYFSLAKNSLIELEAMTKNKKDQIYFSTIFLLSNISSDSEKLKWEGILTSEFNNSYYFERLKNHS